MLENIRFSKLIEDTIEIITKHEKELISAEVEFTEGRQEERVETSQTSQE